MYSLLPHRSPLLIPKGLGPIHFKIKYDSDDEPVLIHQNPFAPKERDTPKKQRHIHTHLGKYPNTTRAIMYAIHLASNAPDQYTRMNAFIQFFEEVLRSVDWLRNYDEFVCTLHEKIDEVREYTSERGNILKYPSECYRLNTVMDHLLIYV